MIQKQMIVEIGEDRAILETYILDTLRVNPKRKRPAVIICPGGGYENLSDREGEPIAIRMNAAGFHAFVLKYSVKPAVFPQALLELSKAVCLIRDHAKEWDVDSGKVIVCGFSAGGHLACSLGTFWHEKWISKAIGRGNKEFRPNGLILGYPVITAGDFAHEDSLWNLSGGVKKLWKKLSLEEQVTEYMPRVFLWHTYEDNLVPVENSLLLANALKKQGISLEMHIYPHGPHGLALADRETGMADGTGGVELHCQNWLSSATEWICLQKRQN